MNRWQLVQKLFEETAALDPDDRSSVLRERGNGDEDLVRSVEALVAADAARNEMLDGTAADLLREIRDEPPPDDLCGKSFGSFRIEEHLSSGGMGHVYRATRIRAGTERRVAVKVLRPGLDTAAFLLRFQRERETLASLEHEHIVAFLDAGALPDGRPYLVMEMVDGVPLTEWGREVPPRERLEMFLQVLSAVQHAHQQLIVHRDLKPSNVLVTAQGVPKLLDFGVATVMEAEEGEAAARAPLTPSYASPEALLGDPVTTASDVYSLGVLLDELVSGELPGSELRLGGDLGAIVGKALEREPARRYASVDRLADDVRRYLANEPVTARPRTWIYRASLFARRNTWPLVLAAAVALALIVGWVGAYLDRRDAELDASIGWGAHGQAKAAARVYESWILEAATSDTGLGDRAAAHLEAALGGELARLPEAEVLVRLTLADLYLEAGQRQKAILHVERAWELAQATRGVGEVDRSRARSLRDRLRSGG